MRLVLSAGLIDSYDITYHLDSRFIEWPQDTLSGIHINKRNNEEREYARRQAGFSVIVFSLDG